jgi:hypothetical protein
MLLNEQASMARNFVALGYLHKHGVQNESLHVKPMEKPQRLQLPLRTGDDLRV